MVGIKTHIFKYSVERKHSSPSFQEFGISGGNYNENKFRRKVAESLLMNEKQSTLNT